MINTKKMLFPEYIYSIPNVTGWYYLLPFINNNSYAQTNRINLDNIQQQTKIFLRIRIWHKYQLLLERSPHGLHWIVLYSTVIYIVLYSLYSNVLHCLTSCSIALRGTLFTLFILRPKHIEWLTCIYHALTFIAINVDNLLIQYF